MPHAWASEAYATADERRSIASEGLEHAANEHDRCRYDRVLRCSARLLVGIEQRPRSRSCRTSRVSCTRPRPQIGADAMVLEEGRVLLVQRTDSGLWCMPGGASGVGETLAQAAEREFREEAGIEGKAHGVVALLDSRLWHSGMKRHMVHVDFRVQRISGTPAKSVESSAAGHFAESDLPPLSHGHRDWLPLRLAQRRQGEAGAYFDR